MVRELATKSNAPLKAIQTFTWKSLMVNCRDVQAPRCEIAALALMEKCFYVAPLLSAGRARAHPGAVARLQSILSFDENIWCIFNYKCWTWRAFCMVCAISSSLSSLALCLDGKKEIRWKKLLFSCDTREREREFISLQPPPCNICVKKCALYTTAAAGQRASEQQWCVAHFFFCK